MRILLVVVLLSYRFMRFNLCLLRAIRAICTFGSCTIVMSPLNTVAAELSDTGQTLCYTSAAVAGPCTAAVTGDVASLTPRQDGRYGRDPAAALGLVTKIGAGAASFDYTKIANNGSVLAATAALGTTPTSWACTRDNLTGLTWEVKTNAAGLRRNSHTYTWYSTASTNGGQAGAVGTNTCSSTLAASQCNTQSYVDAVNTANLCNANDWRLPTQRELLSLIFSGAAPAFDATYFPNLRATTIDIYWTISTRANTLANAWSVYFERGQSLSAPKTSAYLALVVRGGL